MNIFREEQSSESHIIPSRQEKVEGLSVDVAHDDQPALLPDRPRCVLELETLDNNVVRRGLRSTGGKVDQPTVICLLRHE